MKLTVVVENTVPGASGGALLGEYGLSILIQTAGKSILYDTGQSGLVLQNLSRLGVHPSTLDAVVLSHGHFDHAGGLPVVVEHARKELPIYLSPEAFKVRFSHSRGEKRFIGIPWRPERLPGGMSRFRFVEEPLQVADNLWLSGTVPRVTPYERGDDQLRDDQGRPDNHPDDLSLYYRSDKGLVVVSGCAHAGIINVIRHGLAVTGCDRLRAIVGGTHLGLVAEAQREAALEELDRLNPDLVAACHCTGFSVLARMAGMFGKRCVPAFTGTVFDF
ncbi:MBL fold metallo-hydrolase [Heliobacterium undosum]|uniref:MBL fold metallo-hydrolase n=1 Tax=Heliomicrobium undosum TaxID=121734 RepID=A0A845L5R1_9FIRM|nr:MBL fold metallo-hydrolase [Heliomicrobium undosum]MZP28271.1 MBL fold metallo-hydrolase [Heliomicrobium undosum]